MGLVVAQGSTAWNSADGATTTYAVDLSGSGFSAGQPLKALIVFANSQANSTDATASADMKICFGVATGTAARGCGSAQSDDGATACAADRVLRTDCVASFLSISGGDDGRLDLSAFSSTGFTFIVDVVTAANKRVHWIALGGSDFDVATVGSFIFTADTATTQDVTVTGFEASPATPDQCVFIIDCGNIAADSVQTSLGLCIGVAAGSSPTNYMAGVRSTDAADPMDTSSYCLTGEVSGSLIASQAVTSRSSISAWGADKFVFNRIEALATDKTYIYLAMKGPSFLAGDFTIPTDTTPFSETSFGFAPSGALFFSCGRAASTADTATVGAELSIGAAASVADQQCVSIYDEDNAATADCDHSVQYGDVVAVWSSGGGTLDATVALDSFDIDGLTLHATDAAGTSNKFVWYLVVGTAVINPTGIASAEAFGTSAVTLNINTTGIASAEAFGTASITRNINTTGIASTEAFGTASVTRDVNPTGISSAEAFGTGAVTLSISLTSVGSAEAFGTAQLDQNMSLTGIASSQAFGTTFLNLEIQLNGISSAEAFGTLSSTASVSLVAIASGEAFGSHQLDLNALLNGIATQETFGTTLVEYEPLLISLTGISSGAVMGVPVLVYEISLTGIPPGSMGAPKIYEGDSFEIYCFVEEEMGDILTDPDSIITSDPGQITTG